MPTIIQIKRGDEADMPTLAEGEPAFTLDTHKLFIGDGAINHEIGGGGSGDVTAASAFGTDNRVIRSDGAGKGVQASSMTIEDTGNATVSGTITASNLSGTNTGDQTITLTGDVTGSGTGSFAATISDNAVTDAKLADMPAYSFKGNPTGSTASPQDIVDGTLTSETPASGDQIVAFRSSAAGEMVTFDFDDFGGAAWTESNQTADFNVGTTDRVIYTVGAVTGGYTGSCAVPAASTNSGKMFAIKLTKDFVSATPLTVLAGFTASGNANDKIDNVYSIVLRKSGDCVVFYSNGTHHMIIADNRELTLAEGGWTPSTGTWAYASADSPTFTLTVDRDVTSEIGVGNKIKLTQTTAKYFIVTAISYSSPNTTITLYGGTDYTLANAAISSPCYSYLKSPVGFPMSPAKWTVKVTDANDKQITTPTLNTWYGGANAFSTGGNITISVPIGVWRIGWSAYQYVLDTSATITTMEATLSSSNNSESDEELTASIGGNGASSTMTVRQTTRAETIVTLAAKTTYYLLLRTETTGMTDLNLAGTNRASIITAECVYL